MFQFQMQRPNEGLALKLKKNLINDWENIAYWEESKRSEVLTNMCGLLKKKQPGGLGWSQ